MTQLDASHWDCIVVGAGSAGAPLAARLSEDPKRRVLLLEAGPDLHGSGRPASLDEQNVYGMIADGRFFWDGLEARVTDEREPQRYLAGRISGGGSSINGQAAVRPLPDDLDSWAASGCEGWSARELLPVLQRLECDLDFGGWDGHGKEGPFPVRRPPREEWSPVDLALEQAAVGAGFARIPDINAPGALGVTAFPVNRRAGRRYSTAVAYLDATRSRPNFGIAADACVEAVRIEAGRACGVDAVVGGARQRLGADLVVLCAGALLTPAILMRSGVGPGDALRALGITPVADLPVGHHLLEHANAAVVLELVTEARLPSPEPRGSNCCIRYSSQQPGCPEGDMWLWANGAVGHQGRGLERGLLGVSVFGSFSEGSVGLASADPAIPPRVNLRMLSDERDRRRLADGLRRTLDLAADAAFREIASAHSIPGLWDGNGAPPSGEDLLRGVAAVCTPAFHAAGSCRMGAPTDPTSVVDPQCRVLGVERLRVADASVMPHHVRANPHLTAVMIGERVAELVAGGTADAPGSTP